MWSKWRRGSTIPWESSPRWLKLKLFCQSLCKKKLDWDEELWAEQGKVVHTTAGTGRGGTNRSTSVLPGWNPWRNAVSEFARVLRCLSGRICRSGLHVLGDNGRRVSEICDRENSSGEAEHPKTWAAVGPDIGQPRNERETGTKRVHKSQLYSVHSLLGRLRSWATSDLWRSAWMKAVRPEPDTGDTQSRTTWSREILCE